jgi:hypothetical protein
LRAAAHEAATLLSTLTAADWIVEGVHQVRGKQTVGAIIQSLLTEHVEEHAREALQAAGIASADG